MVSFGGQSVGRRRRQHIVVQHFQQRLVGVRTQARTLSARTKPDVACPSAVRAL
jgi:hypothetical protein